MTANPVRTDTSGAAFLPLPGSKVLPVIIIDTREQTPLVFERLPSKVGTLTTGDYGIEGVEHLFAVERKTVADLVQCVSHERERFERELARMAGCRFRRLLIVGSREEIEGHRYRGDVSPAAVLHSLAAWEVRFALPVVFATTPEDAARVVERWAWFFAREVCRDARLVIHAGREVETCAK